MSSTNQSVIKISNILFHNKEDEYNIYDKEEMIKFGVLTLEIESTPITQVPQQIHSENDMSGSMQDLCIDGRSKMEHLNLTLENIISLLSENGDQTNIVMGISGFDDKITQVLEATRIRKDQEQVQKIHESIRGTLKPRGMTNIGLAIENAKKKLSNVQDGKNSFILMTDGQITTGATNKEWLTNALPNNSDNYLIGFGKDHDFNLLQTLANKNMGQYFYVDKIENAGLVFGEIIHTILYPALMKATITTTNGEIYDFINNIWTNSLQIPTICSEQTKHFHVRSTDPEIFELTINGATPFGEISHNEIKLPDLVNEDGTLETVDLRKYMYRQKTLELLAQAKEIIINNKEYEEKSKMQKVLCEFRGAMQIFSDTEDIDKAYMKQLLDDLYICEKTLHSENALLYNITRQCAQGRETSNNMTQINDEDIMRQDAVNDEDEDHYEISDCALNRSNTTPHQMEIMRSCSNQPSKLKRTLKDEDDENNENIPPPPLLTRCSANPIMNYEDLNNPVKMERS